MSGIRVAAHLGFPISALHCSERCLVPTIPQTIFASRQNRDFSESWIHSHHPVQPLNSNGLERCQPIAALPWVAFFICRSTGFHERFGAWLIRIIGQF